MSEENKSIIKQSSQKFSEHYSENPLTALLLTALGILVPQIAIGKEAIDRAVSKIQKERFQTLLDELSKGEKLITPELVEAEEFIHSFVVVYQASMNTFQREKIRRFARILLTAIEKHELASDKFAEYVRILENLSDRELLILTSLVDLEKGYTKSKDVAWSKDKMGPSIGLANWGIRVTHGIWREFIKINTLEHNISTSTLLSLLKRLESTGLYIGVHTNSSEEIQEIGTTTFLFDDFAEWIKLENEKLNADG
jgi:hypothetical protein